MSVVWLDGELVDKADAKIGVADHGLLFGDGVTADMRAYGGRVFRLAQHLDRLHAAADDIGLSLPVAGSDLASAIDATLKANNRADGFVKLVVTRGAGPLTLDPRKCVPVMFILAEEAAPFPRELYDCGLDVTVQQVTWRSADCYLGGSGRLGPKRTALANGCLEALVTDKDDSLAGGSETDVAVVAGGVLRFAPGGPTHDAVADLAESLGLAVERDAVIPLPEVPPAGVTTLGMDEVFLTSAAAQVIGVRSVLGRPVGAGGEGPVTRRLRREFAAMVRAECAVN